MHYLFKLEQAKDLQVEEVEVEQVEDLQVEQVENHPQVIDLTHYQSWTVWYNSHKHTLWAQKKSSNHRLLSKILRLALLGFFSD